MEVSDTTSDGREGQRTGSLRQHHLGAGLYIQVNTAFRNAPAFVWPNVPPASSDAPVAPLPPHCDRAAIFQRRDRIAEFLTRKWARILDYRWIKELWAFHDNRIAGCFACEYHNDSGTWFRAYSNENWEFRSDGLMQRRIASMNEHPICEGDRAFRCASPVHPYDH